MPTNLIVHGLLAGLPLCRFTDEVPRDWPEGHVWTELGDTEHMTCAECKSRALEYIAKRTTTK